MTEAGKRSCELFILLRVPDGSARQVKMTGFFTDEYRDGKQMAYTTMVDVTELMQIQQEKTVACDNTPGFIVKHRILPDKVIMADASDRITDIFNMDAGKLDSFGIYSMLEPENRTMIEASHESFRQEEPLDGTICLRDRYTRERWFSIHSTCIGSIVDDPVYLIVLIGITDVTELRIVQKRLTGQKTALRDALEAAKHVNRTKSDFLSRMSHDLRTPLNAIQEMARIIKSHVYDPERVLDSADKIMLSNDLLISLIDEVLDASRVEGDQMLLAGEEVNLAGLVQGVVDVVQPQLGEKNLRFKTCANRITHETIISDLQHLQQLLLNLLSNAMEYTPEDESITLEINEKSSEQTDMAYYEFAISDTGIDMKPEFLARVFEPFERADDTKIQAAQETGLGMSIYKKAAGLMGGTIGVESTYGKDSRFAVSVYLQAQEVKIDDSVLTGLHALVVDDDEITCRNICERLEELQMTVKSASDGQTAISEVEATHTVYQDCFVIFLDCRMPGLDGVETTRQIREKVGNNLPIIMLSAYDLSDQVDAAKEAGANGFITKPLFRSQLVYKLEQSIGAADMEEPEAWKSTRCSYAGKRTLLVEDDALNQEVAIEMLVKSGIPPENVDVAKDRQTAADRVKASRPNTYGSIFMDVQIPVMDGCTAAIQIRALPHDGMEAIPVIAITANAFDGDRKKTKDAGMNGHLAKSVEPGRLRQVLET